GPAERQPAEHVTEIGRHPNPGVARGGAAPPPPRPCPSRCARHPVPPGSSVTPRAEITLSWAGQVSPAGSYRRGGATGGRHQGREYVGVCVLLTEPEHLVAAVVVRRSGGQQPEPLREGPQLLALGGRVLGVVDLQAPEPVIGKFLDVLERQRPVLPPPARMG